MEKDKRTGWLKELKVGDVVLVEYTGNSNRYDGSKFGVVARITPTGRIVVYHQISKKIRITGETQYSPEGYKKEGLFPTRLKKLTPEAKQEYLLEQQEDLQESQRTELLNKTRNALNNLNLDKMNTRELQALYDYIKNGD